MSFDGAIREAEMALPPQHAVRADVAGTVGDVADGKRRGKITIKGLSKSFGDTIVYDNFDLEFLRVRS